MEPMQTLERIILKAIATGDIASTQDGSDVTINLHNGKLGRVYAYKVAELLREGKLLPGKPCEISFATIDEAKGAPVKLNDNATLIAQPDNPDSVLLSMHFPKRTPAQVRHDITWLLTDEEIKDKVPSKLQPLENGFRSIFDSQRIQAHSVKAIGNEIIVTIDQNVTAKKRNEVIKQIYTAGILEQGDLRTYPLREKISDTESIIRIPIPADKRQTAKVRLLKEEQRLFEEQSAKIFQNDPASWLGKTTASRSKASRHSITN
jgi:hypothetical protein